MNGTIHIQDFELPCFVGVYDHEKRGLQNLYLSLTVIFDISKAVITDSIHDTIDYDHLIQISINIAQKKHFNLIETLAFEITEALLNQYTPLKSVIICLKKPLAIEKAKWSAVTLERMR